MLTAICEEYQPPMPSRIGCDAGQLFLPGRSPPWSPLTHCLLCTEGQPIAKAGLRRPDIAQDTVGRKHVHVLGGGRKPVNDTVAKFVCMSQQLGHCFVRQGPARGGSPKHRHQCIGHVAGILIICGQSSQRPDADMVVTVGFHRFAHGGLAAAVPADQADNWHDAFTFGEPEMSVLAVGRSGSKVAAC